MSSRTVISGSPPPQPANWTPPWLAGGSAARWLAANAAVTILYFALGAVVSGFFSAYGMFPAPIWLPASVAIVAAMIGDVRLFPGIFVGSFLVNSILFTPAWYVTTIISTTNAAGPVLGALALRRLRPADGLFTTFAGIIAFLFCTIFLAPAISAAGGALALAVGQPLDLAQSYSIWVNWWLTDSGGTLYLAPALILWLGLEHESEAMTAGIKPGFDRRDLAVWAWIAVFSLVLFLTPPLRGTDIRSAFPFLLVVPLSWIALRMSLRSAYTLVSLVAIVATAGTVAGVGPFQNHSLANPLLLVGTLVVLLAANVLTIVALVSERHQAQNANRVKSMFLANTSHELETPLNAIIGFSSMMHGEMANPLSNEEYTKYARLIQSSGEHLLALINDLLAMSKIEAGRFDLNEEPVALARDHRRGDPSHGAAGARQVDCRRYRRGGERHDAAGRSQGAAPDPAQRPLQRRQVHPGGRPDRDRDGAEWRGRCRRHHLRYRHRHPARGAGAHLQAVRARSSPGHAEDRGNRARPLDHPRPRHAARRHHRARQHAGRRHGRHRELARRARRLGVERRAAPEFGGEGIERRWLIV